MLQTVPASGLADVLMPPREPVQRMGDELGMAGRAGSREDPFRRQRREPIGSGRRGEIGINAGKAGQRLAMRECVIRHADVDLGIAEDGGDLVRAEARRDEHHAAREAVDRQHGEGGRALAAGRDEDAAVVEAAAQLSVAEASDGAGKRDARLSVRDRQPGEAVRTLQPLAQDHCVRPPCGSARGRRARRGRPASPAGPRPRGC